MYGCMLSLDGPKPFITIDFSSQLPWMLLAVLLLTFAHKRTLNPHTWSFTLVEIWKHFIYWYLSHLFIQSSVHFSLLLLSIRGCVVSKFIINVVLMLGTAKIVLPYMYFLYCPLLLEVWYSNILILILLLDFAEWGKLYLLCNQQIGKTGLLQAAQIRFYVNKRQDNLHRPASWPRPHTQTYPGVGVWQVKWALTNEVISI